MSSLFLYCLLEEGDDSWSFSEILDGGSLGLDANGNLFGLGIGEYEDEIQLCYYKFALCSTEAGVDFLTFVLGYFSLK